MIEFLDYDAAAARSLPVSDAYYHPAYGWSAELIDGGRWECAVSRDGDISFAYIVRPIAETAGRHFDLVTPYGYGGLSCAPRVGAGTLRSFRSDFLAQARERGLVAEFLRLNPLEDHSALVEHAVSVVSHPTFGSHIATPEAEWAAASGKHRTAVRKAQRNGVAIEEVDPAHLIDREAAFRQIYDAAMLRLNARDSLRLDDEYYQRLCEMPPGAVRLLYAHVDGEVVAASIFLVWQDRVHYHLSGASDEGRRLQATSALIAHASSLLPSPFTLHLGGGLSADDPLARFKQASSSASFHTQLVRNVVDAAVYRELAGVAPEAPGYFPAYRDPQRKF